MTTTMLYFVFLQKFHSLFWAFTPSLFSLLNLFAPFLQFERLKKAKNVEKKNVWFNKINDSQ